MQTRCWSVAIPTFERPAAQLVVVLLGQGSLDDVAVGEVVEIGFGTAAGVRGRPIKASTGRHELTVTNDGPSAIRYDAELAVEGQCLKADTRLGKRDGRPFWTVTVPANGTRNLRNRYDPAASIDRGRASSLIATKVNMPSVTLTSVAPRSRVATTSILICIDVRPTFSTSA